MILLSERAPGAACSRVIAIFGLGLIGSAVRNALEFKTPLIAEPYRFRWVGVAEAREDTVAIARRIVELLQASDESDGVPNLTFVWSAGRAGFSASEKEIACEFESFCVVLDLMCSLSEAIPGIKYSLHLVSSLGGLYEGTKNVNSEDPAAPMRAYGRLKLRQELLSARMIPGDRLHIYRPSSVYDYLGPGFRMGLIPTLVRNGMRNQVSKIVGDLSTLRDYVLASDVGSFIATRVLSGHGGFTSGTYMLASGKPSTIFEVQQAVEERLGRRIYVSFANDLNLKNASNITVSRSALPSNWVPVDLRTGIAFVTERMYHRGAIAAYY